MDLLQPAEGKGCVAIQIADHYAGGASEKQYMVANVNVFYEHFSRNIQIVLVVTFVSFNIAVKIYNGSLAIKAMGYGVPLRGSLPFIVYRDTRCPNDLAVNVIRLYIVACGFNAFLIAMMYLSSKLTFL